MNAVKPVRDWDRLILRLPDGMRDQLAEQAAENCRPLNGEIIHLLKRGLAAEKSASQPSA